MKSIIGPVLLFCEVKKEYYILFKAQKQNHLNILNLIPVVHPLILLRSKNITLVHVPLRIFLSLIIIKKCKTQSYFEKVEYTFLENYNSSSCFVKLFIYFEKRQNVSIAK